MKKVRFESKLKPRLWALSVEWTENDKQEQCGTYGA